MNQYLPRIVTATAGWKYSHVAAEVGCGFRYRSQACNLGRSAPISVVRMALLSVLDMNRYWLHSRRSKWVKTYREDGD
jgi:hypothetical protein